MFQFTHDIFDRFSLFAFYLFLVSYKQASYRISLLEYFDLIGNQLWYIGMLWYGMVRYDIV